MELAFWGPWESRCGGAVHRGFSRRAFTFSLELEGQMLPGVASRGLKMKAQLEEPFLETDASGLEPGELLRDT